VWTLQTVSFLKTNWQNGYVLNEYGGVAAYAVNMEELNMSDEKPPMPPGLPPMPPMPPAPPGTDAPAAPLGLPPMPPMPSMDAPPAPPGMPPMPPMPEMGAPPAPPGMPPMPPMPEMGAPLMDAPPAPPGMPPMPPMPEMGAPPMDAPPAPPGLDAFPPMPPMPEMEAPPMDAPPAPPGMPPMPPMPEMEAPPMDAPPAPPGMPPMPPMPEMEAPSMDAPPAPPGMPPMPPMPEMDAPPMDAPPSLPGLDAFPPMPPMPEMEAPPMDAPPAPPGLDAFPPMPPMPEMEAEAPAVASLMMDSAALLGSPTLPPMPEMEAEAPAEESSVKDNSAWVVGGPAPSEATEESSLLSGSAALLGGSEAPDESKGILPLPASLSPDSLLGAPDNLMGEQAGAIIRTSAEVDEVIGDKLEGTLHEVEKATLSADGEVIKQIVKGSLKINNPSAEDRVYDIDVMLDYADATDIGGDNVSVDELEAGANYSMKYKVTGKRMLVLRERLDTNPARSQEHSLSVASSDEGGPIALELEVENVGSVAISNVIVTRPLPKEFNFASTGVAVLDDHLLTWEVGSLSAGEKQVLSIEGTIVVSGTKSINAGVASATYTSNSTLSNLNFRELDAFCRGFSYMRVREDERPDNWLCRTTFENRSSFAVDLVKLQVRMKGSDDLLFDISDVRQDVKPHGKWESEERTVMAQSKPDFTTELAYTILPRASRSTEGSISLESKTLQVVEANLEKVYSTTGLRSYRSQKVTACLTLTNNGSSDINLMRITDDVPGLFNAPDVSTMTIKINGKELDAEQIKAEINSGITLEKTNRSPDGDGHTLSITVGARGPVGLKPGKDMTIEYDLIAPDPSPDNSNITAPARTEFSAERYGPVCTRDTTEAPAISVIHNRRDFSFGKTTQKIGGKGRHEVLILFSNDGDTALQDVILSDIIPEKFEIKDWLIRGNNDKRDDCVMTSDSGEGGTHLTWTIPIVEKGERLEVSFEITGPGVIDGEAGNRFHGVHFGDEVETEDIASPVDEAVEESDEELEAEEEIESNISWREDVLLRVMAAADIDVSERDAFVAHAVNFDLDDNGYLKKVELEAAADAWNANASTEEEVAAEESETEEAAEESETEEAPEAEEAPEESETEEAPEESPEESETEEASEKNCPICMAINAHDAGACTVCSYSFE
jgi:hypothetical protein